MSTLRSKRYSFLNGEIMVNHQGKKDSGTVQKVVQKIFCPKMKRRVFFGQ